MQKHLPVFCSREEDRCGVAAAVVAIEPIRLSDLAFPFERCRAVRTELFSNKIGFYYGISFTNF